MARILSKHYTNEDHAAAEAVEKLHRMTDGDIEPAEKFTPEEAQTILSLCDHKKDAKRYRKRIMKLHQKKYPSNQ